MQPASDAREPFPIRHIDDVEPTPPEAQWLVEQLVLALACAIIGGAPRCWKTWLAAELAMAVATGGKALGLFQARVSGPVLFYGAEDSLAALKARFLGLARARGVALKSVPLYLLDVAEVRIDSPRHLARLRCTLDKVKPALVVLEPFVRLARVDENSATEVSPVLGDLRTIQREHSLVVLIAHHMRKSPSAHLGQQLRGSGDFAAWSDSGLYLTSKGSQRLLQVEHRNAPAPPPVRLQLTSGDDAHLAVLDDGNRSPSHAEEDPLRASILDLLVTAPAPLTTSEIRDTLKVRKATLVAALEELQRAGAIARVDGRWTLAGRAD